MSTSSDRRRWTALAGFACFLLVLVAGTLRAPHASAGLSTPAAIALEESTATTSQVPASTAQDTTKLTIPQAIVLGVVEGVTEFLPISSTGHLTVVERLMGLGTSDADKEAADAYAVVIQAGAILAVVVLYHQRLVSILKGLVGKDDDGRKLLLSLIIAFLPAAMVGFVFEKKIKEHLFGPWPVIAAWVLGGVVLLILSTKGWFERERHGGDVLSLTWRTALVIGVAQCLALWPGTSRSLVTIVAAVLIGLSLPAAVEFSFLLGLVTLGAATVFDAAKHGGQIVDNYGAVSPVIGFVFAFLAAVLAVKWMVSYLQNHSLAIFGWYRLGIAAVATGLVAAGRL